MAKGYWIARVDVENDSEYASYRALNGVAFAKYGGRFLVRGGVREVIKGAPRKHDVVIEFDSYDQALACYHSDEYQAALSHLSQVGPTDLVIIAGYDGQQPGT